MYKCERNAGAGALAVAGFCQSRAPARQQPGCGLRRTHAGVGHTLPKEAGSAYGGGRQRLAERLHAYPSWTLLLSLTLANADLEVVFIAQD